MDKKIISGALIASLVMLFSTISQAADVTLSWNASASEVQGYRIYYGTTHGNYTDSVNVGNVTQYKLSGLQANVTYYFVTRAYNGGAESGNSNEVSWSYETNGDTTTVEFGDAANSDYPGSIQDTFTNAGDPNSNFSSSSENLIVYTWPSNTNANSILIKWDLSTFPANATILSADLMLFMSEYSATGGDDLYEISVHKILNHDADISQCTWATCDGVTSWTGGADGGQSDVTGAEDTRMVDKSAGYKHWDVTQMVSDWVTAPASNFGMMLLSDKGSNKASANTNRIFVSSEDTDASKRPKLVISYAIGDSDLSPPAAPKGIRIIGVK